MSQRIIIIIIIIIRAFLMRLLLNYYYYLLLNKNILVYKPFFQDIRVGQYQDKSFWVSLKQR